MARTKQRALVKGDITGQAALAYAAVLGIIGFVILALYTNFTTVSVGIFGLFAYLVMYSVGKRQSVHGTVIGSLAGATPPVAGYTAVTNHLDVGALCLFLILVFWQMPHFYAIAMYRFKDYKAAGLPVLPVVKGPRTAKVQILLYIIAFILAAAALTLFGYTGYAYLIISLGLGLTWLWKGIKGFQATDDRLWARRMFLVSLIVLTVLSLMLGLSAWLP